MYDYKRFVVLYVDDEEMSLKYFTRAFSNTFRVLTAPNATAGFRLLEDHQDEIAVVMTDQRMPGEQGVQFLERARRLRPQIIRILATAFADLDAAIGAVNTGAIYKYVTKPWDPQDLEMTLKRSIEFFSVQVERDRLLREKLSVIHRLVITDRVLSMGIVAAGLSRQVRNAVDAVGTFLELAPTVSRSDGVDLDRLRDKEFWTAMNRRVHDRLKFVLGVLDDLATEPASKFAFNQEIRVHEAIDQAIQPLAAELAAKKIEVANLVPPTLPPLLVDGSRFKKLFVLLLRHELASLKEDSVVRFEAAERTVEGGPTEEVSIFVNDNGAGLSAKSVLGLFDPLIGGEEAGSESEMFLMAVYFIVYHHGGRVQVGHRSGRGLALTIHLPLRPKPSDPVDESQDFLVRAMTNERLWDRLMAGN